MIPEVATDFCDFFFIQCDGEKATLQESQTDCTRCRQRDLKCVFEESTKQLKEDLIETLKSVKEVNAVLKLGITERDKIISELQRDVTVHDDILLSICRGHQASELSRRIRDKEPHHEIAAWLRQSLSTSPTDGSKTYELQGLQKALATFEADCRGRSELQSIQTQGPVGTSWTVVTSDAKLMTHLLDLYFAYVHPFHMLFDEIRFRQDYQNDCSIHCSKSLFNAVCAMACFLYETRAEQGGDWRSYRSAETTLMRKAFVNEAMTSLKSSHQTELTDVQAFAIMFLVNLSSGKAGSAVGYLKTAMDKLQVVTRPQQSSHAKELTIVGLRTLKT